MVIFILFAGHMKNLKPLPACLTTVLLWQPEEVVINHTTGIPTFYLATSWHKTVVSLLCYELRVEIMIQVSGGQAVSQATSGSQVISHAVLTKAPQVSAPGQTLQTRVIPVSSTQQALKQTIQVRCKTHAHYSQKSSKIMYVKFALELVIQTFHTVRLVILS